jgi:uncharacterized protein
MRDDTVRKGSNHSGEPVEVARGARLSQRGLLQGGFDAIETVGHDFSVVHGAMARKQGQSGGTHYGNAVLWHTEGMSARGEVTFRTPTADDPVLDEIVLRLRETYRPLRIYLFGSVARGDAGPDSDYDICVVVPDDAPRDLREPVVGYRALWGVGLATDVVVWTLGEFEKRLHLKASFPSTVLREGRLLYAA